MANFKRQTRYTGGLVQENRSGQEFLVLRLPLNLEPSDGDVFVEVTQDIIDRPDLIAQKAYGNTNLWWAIYEFNGIRDPLFELQMGQILRIPELERVERAIQELEDQ
jgi:hypothetical protein